MVEHLRLRGHREHRRQCAESGHDPRVNCAAAPTRSTRQTFCGVQGRQRRM